MNNFLTFLFEKDLVNEVVVQWVSTHPHDCNCKKVVDTHYKAQRERTKEAIDVYERALRELWVLRPWDNEDTNLIILAKKEIVIPAFI